MKSREKGTYALIETEYGNIELRLYDETPRHRDNFIKLAKEGFYDGLLFHRVIKDFMIQGGDPTSRKAAVEEKLGTGDLDYTIPSEIISPQLFHKKGALAAARLPDSVNSERASSASQFFLVTGTTLTARKLSEMEKQGYERLKQKIFNELQILNKDSIKELYRNGNKEMLAELRNNMVEEALEEAKERKDETLFTPVQQEIYTTIGGAPHLDGEYTVFGELVKGLDVLDKIQEVATNANDRPLKDIRMKITIED